MSLFSLLRKPAWEHPNPSRRAAAVGSETHPDLLAKLPDIVRQDDDAGVRLAALRRINDISLLGDRMRHDGDAAVRDTARQRYLQRLLDASIPATERERFVQVEEDADVLAAIATQAPEPDLRRLALERSTRAGLLLERCVSDPDAGVRRWILERIDDVAALDRIADRVRKSDKLLARAARERAQAARLAAGDSATVEARVLAICDELDALRRDVVDDAARQRDTLAAEWQQLKRHVDAAMERRVAGYFDALDTFLAGPPPAETPVEPAPEPVATVETPAREPDVALAALLAELEARFERLEPRSLDQLEIRWKARCETLQPLLPEEQQQDRQFRDKAGMLRQRFQQRAQQRQAALDGLESKLQQLETAIANGQVATARDIQRDLDADRQLLQRSFPAALGRRLGSAARKLDELGQWQRWSNNKARQALISEVEELGSSGLHPDAVASRIKELQGEWQSLDDVDGRSGHPLARRFYAACRQGLEPARPYFEKRRELRGMKQEEVEAFLDETGKRLGQQGDVRELLRMRQQVIDRLRRSDELDPAARRELSRRLRDTLDRVNKAIEASEQEGEAAKRKLLANLRRDLMHAELADALPIAREAQRQWKSLPRAARKTDDALWKELRELVDPWFNQADEKQRERRAAESTLVEQAEALIADANALAEADDNTLLQAESRLGDLQARWQSLLEKERDTDEPAPPARDDRRAPHRKPPRRILDERGFDRAVANVRKAHDALLERRQRAEYAVLLDAGKLCDQLDALPADAGDGQRDALLEQLAALDVAGDARSRLNQRIDGTVENPAADAPAPDTQAMALTLTAELALGIESPEADRELRRQLQIERLSRHLSEGGEQAEDLRAMLLDYIALPEVTPLTRNALAPRWQTIVQAMTRD